jgi:serine/threonine-protein kinase RsbW
LAKYRYVPCHWNSWDTLRLDTPPFHLRLPATLDSVSALLDALEAYAEEAGIAPGIAARLALVAEEVAANVAMHAAGATYFALRVTRDGGHLGLCIEDDGPEYDPLARATPDTAAALEDRDVGGLGVHLVRELTQDARYERAAGLNRLVCALPLGG